MEEKETKTANLMSKFYSSDDTGNWEATPILRYVQKSGRKVLQQRFINVGPKHQFKWYDVPLYTEEGKQ